MSAQPYATDPAVLALQRRPRELVADVRRAQRRCPCKDAERPLCEPELYAAYRGMRGKG